jgi:hypothetical protein
MQVRIAGVPKNNQNARRPPYKRENERVQGVCWQVDPSTSFKEIVASGGISCMGKHVLEVRQS